MHGGIGPWIRVTEPGPSSDELLKKESSETPGAEDRTGEQRS